MRRVALIGAVLTLMPVPAARAAAAPPEYEVFAAEALAYWNMGQPACAPLMLEVRSLIPGRDGQAEPQSCTVAVAVGLAPCIAKDVVFHEVGHLLGLPHSADPESIMYPEATVRFCIVEDETINAAVRIAQRREEALETRAWCREMPPGAQRRHCFRHVRRMMHPAPLPGQ